MFQIHETLVSPELGGAGLLALQLTHRLASLGQSCRVWIPGSGPACTESVRLGLPCGFYDAAGALGRSRLRAAYANWRFQRSLNRFGPGLVHVHSPGYYGALRWGLRRSGLSRVVHVQLEEGPELLQWAFQTPPELIITCARFLADYLKRILPAQVVERTRIVAVPNAVDIERFCPGPKATAKASVAAPIDRPLAVMLANLAPHKGQETAIRTAAVLKSRGIDVLFWLAGSERGGSNVYSNRLESLIRELGVGDCVKLLGQRSDTPDLLRAADFFLLPSTCEGLPISLLEAQACRVPILASPTAGVPEVVEHDVTGFLIPADDPVGYAEHIAQLLGDRGRTERMTEVAHRQVRTEYSWTTYCRRILALYQEVSGVRGSNPESGSWPTSIHPGTMTLPASARASAVASCQDSPATNS